MARGPIQLWNGWATQILILLSFALQLFLFVFSRTRRRGSSALLRILLWLAYLMADSTAVYTLGHLSISGLLHEHQLGVFWAPFLLVHLGSQDTITAYALEDNHLWPRHLLNLGVQAFGVAYILYKHIAEIPTLMGLASILMFVVGVIKYGERIWALKSATLKSIRSSIKNYRPLPTYYGPLQPWDPIAEHDDEELLLFAQAMLPLCKGAMVDFPVTLITTAIGYTVPYNRYIWNFDWNATRKVVEMELSLMYDILYTKAAVIHHWYGYCIRAFSPLITILAFVLFKLSGNKDGYSRVDVAITHMLLVGAFLLDMASMFSALGSTWTCSFLWTAGWTRLRLFIMSFRRHVKAAGGNRGWSGSVGQFNLLYFCSRDKTKLSSRVAKMMGLEGWWNKRRYSATLVMSQDVKELVFQRVWKALKEIHGPGEDGETQSPPSEEETMAMTQPQIEEAGFGPELYQDTARRRKKLAKALGFGADLQEVILTWHIFTDGFLMCRDTPLGGVSSTYLRAIMTLSDNMAYLIAIRPDTVPGTGLELCSLYEATRHVLEEVWRHKDECGLDPDAFNGLWGEQTEYHSEPDCVTRDQEKLVRILRDFGLDADAHERGVIIGNSAFYVEVLVALVGPGPDKSGLLSHYEDYDRAAMNKLKRLMPNLESSCSDGDFDITKVLELILDTWVRLLILVSVRSSRDAHARQINRGGQLTTVVWLMEEHASMLLKPPAKYESMSPIRFSPDPEFVALAASLMR